MSTTTSLRSQASYGQYQKNHSYTGNGPTSPSDSPNYVPQTLEARIKVYVEFYTNNEQCRGQAVSISSDEQIQFVKELAYLSLYNLPNEQTEKKNLAKAGQMAKVIPTSSQALSLGDGSTMKTIKRLGLPDLIVYSGTAQPEQEIYKTVLKNYPHLEHMDHPSNRWERIDQESPATEAEIQNVINAHR